MLGHLDVLAAVVAKASNDETPIRRASKAVAIALPIVAVSLTPVKDPGPIGIIKPLISFFLFHWNLVNRLTEGKLHRVDA